MGITTLSFLCALLSLSISLQSKENHLFATPSFLDVSDTEADLESLQNTTDSQTIITDDDVDEAIPVFSSSQPYDEQQGDMTDNDVEDYVSLALITPTEDAEGLTWQDIEGTDDIDEAVEGSDNPDAGAWV
ncbi:unnamed protein product [Blepharisma stoltei]|uniref:Uncharacterized protein n=1 Tax=Blepharisma stoltei TaxID=1481888 RepID=A0AAU9IWU8_9CILI|nr:unnamed protein product [Blepharisma stoltei]